MNADLVERLVNERVALRARRLGGPLIGRDDAGGLYHNMLDWRCIAPGTSLYNCRIVLPFEFPDAPPCVYMGHRGFFHLNVCEASGYLSMPSLLVSAWRPETTLVDILDAVQAQMTNPVTDANHVFNQAAYALYSQQEGGPAAHLAAVQEQASNDIYDRLAALPKIPEASRATVRAALSAASMVTSSSGITRLGIAGDPKTELDDEWLSPPSQPRRILCATAGKATAGAAAAATAAAAGAAATAAAAEADAKAMPPPPPRPPRGAVPAEEYAESTRKRKNYM